MVEVITFINTPGDLDLEDVLNFAEDIVKNPGCKVKLVEVEDLGPSVVVYKGEGTDLEIAAETIRHVDDFPNLA